LLDVSRIITGKLRLDVTPVDIAVVADAAVEAVRLSAEAKHITLTCHLDRSGVVVLGDAGRLQQVVWNFLSNAVKYTPEFGRIDLVLERIGTMARIRVTDTGEGIDQAFVPNVFERFRQADSSITRKHGGLGLGLAIVRHLVEAHGGRVGVESAGVGKGATFFADLPLAGPVQPQTHPAAESSGRASTLAGIRILAVDDDEDARELLKTIFTNAGASVTLAENGQDALEKLSALRPHVFVSDIGLPGADGFELLAEVRRTRAADDLPALAITAYTDANTRQRAAEAGYQAFIAKPVNVDELLTATARLAHVRPQPNKTVDGRVPALEP
jgi:CheY-like chemotaxis protein